MSEYISEQVSVHSELVTEVSEEGEWLPKQEAANRLGVSEKTVENRVRSGDYKSERRQGRAFIFIPKLSEGLSESHHLSPKTFASIPKQTEPSENISESFLEYIRNDSEIRSEEIRILNERVRKLESELSEERIKAARLEGEMKGKDKLLAEKDNTIQAKDQAINAANAAVMLMEQQKQTLDAKVPKLIETTLKKPWWRLGF
jgi:hypothetical protein